MLGAYLWKAHRDWTRSQVKGTEPLKTTNIHAKEQRPLLSGSSADYIGQNGSNTGPSTLSLASEPAQGYTETALYRSHVASALWLGLIVDCVDVLSCIACTVEGNVSDLAKVTAGIGAASLAAIGAHQLHILRKKA